MKRKTLYALGLSAVLGFSTLSGCGCGAVQTPESTQQETSTVEEESTSSAETIAQEETPSVIETEAVETESETTGEVTAMEETASTEEIGIIEMDAIMYATTSVNERKKPSADSEKLATVPAGTAVHVTGITEDEQWYQISDYEDIEVGYISGAYLSSEKPSTSSSSGSTSSSSGSSTSTESESATTSESTSTPAETTQPEPETPVETTPAPETPSTSTGGSTTTAPNPGAQEVYDSVNSGQSTFDPNTPAPGATPDNINGDMFGTPKDDSAMGVGSGQGAGGILHAE